MLVGCLFGSNMAYAVVSLGIERDIISDTPAAKDPVSLAEALIDLHDMLQQNRKLEALQKARELVDHYPDMALTQSVLGDVLALNQLENEATQVYQVVLEKYPDDLNARLGLAHLQKKNTPLAKQLYQEVLTRQATHLGALKGLIELTQDVQTRSILIEQALQIAPDDRVLKKQNIKLLMEIGQTEAAVSYARAYQVAYPEEVDSGLQLSVALLADRQTKQAILVLDQFVLHYPDRYEGWQLLGSALARAGEWSAAAEKYDRALVIAPEHVDTLVYRIQLARQLSDWDTAEKYSQVLIAHYPQLGTGWQLRGENALYRQDYQQAVLAFTQAFSIAPSDALLLKLARAQHANRQTDEAIALLTQGVIDYPAQTLIRLQLADYLSLQEQYEPAIAAYQQVLALQPEKVRALNNLAELLLILERKQEALIYAQQAYALKPTEVAVIDTYARALSVTGSNKTALVLFESLVASYPQQGEIRLHYAQALQRAGQKNAAISILIPLVRFASPDFSQLAVAESLLRELEKD